LRILQTGATATGQDAILSAEMSRFDVVVCGLGATGSAALRELSRRGLRALGIERFTPGHDRGSSHGATRIIRLGYFEHPSYVPLLRRAYALWREIEELSGKRLLHITGIAEIGPPDGALIRGVLASVSTHALRHELLSATELMRRIPAFQLPPQYEAVIQPDGGFLAAEPSIHAMLALAKSAGAEIQTGETIRAIEPSSTGVRIVTDRARIDAAAAVVAVGPWITAMLPGLRAPLRVTRQVMAWFAPRDPEPFRPGRFPVFLLESRHGIHYGFPLDSDGLIKVARHHHRDETVDPETCDRTISIGDESLIRAALIDHLPGANGHRAAATSCLYTVAPDGDFVVDSMPGHPHVLIASPCSGHGFKFAPVIGEILADLLTKSAQRHDIDRFSLKRFG
jgi:sarcosine oxidase